jgi:hypothetical protein
MEDKTEKITLNGKAVTQAELEEQQKRAAKTGAKVTESAPGKFVLRLNE